MNWRQPLPRRTLLTWSPMLCTCRTKPTQCVASSCMAHRGACCHVPDLCVLFVCQKCNFIDLGQMIIIYQLKLWGEGIIGNYKYYLLHLQHFPPSTGSQSSATGRSTCRGVKSVWRSGMQFQKTQISSSPTPPLLDMGICAVQGSGLAVWSSWTLCRPEWSPSTTCLATSMKVSDVFFSSDSHSLHSPQPHMIQTLKMGVPRWFGIFGLL